MGTLSSELLQKLELAIEKLDRVWIGQRIRIIEKITRSRDVGKYDRHFSTNSVMELKLSYVGVMFSGSALMLDETGDSHSYQINVNSLVEVQLSTTEIEFTEHFENHTARKSTIKLLESLP